MSDFVSGKTSRLMATEVGKALRKLRQENGEVLGDMAKKLDISTAELSAIELGKVEISSSMIRKIRSVYHQKGVMGG